MFISSKITMKPVSLEDAVKKAQAKAEPRDLDTLLSDLEAQNNGQTRTASVEEKTTKVAEVAESEPVAETKDVVESEVKVEVSPEFDKEDVVEEKAASNKKETKKASKELKIASKLDFRDWEAEKVAGAWDAHGSFDQCVKNVGDNASDAKLYCGLLQVASDKAKQVMEKKASKKAEEQKKASPKGVWKKLAKLTSKEHDLLSDYLKNLYGEEYVKALLSDYPEGSSK